jgi:hypothetical protein
MSRTHAPCLPALQGTWEIERPSKVLSVGCDCQQPAAVSTFNQLMFMQLEALSAVNHSALPK